MKRVVLFLLMVVILLGCKRQSRTEILMRGYAFQLEIADSESKRSTGLMYRESLCDHCGMLFVFDEVGSHPFWMKNTKISLDIIFVGPDQRVAGIGVNTKPYSMDAVGNGILSKYVIEVPAGTAQRIGLSVGDPIVFRSRL